MIGTLVGFAAALPVAFFVGHFVGHRSALWAHRRQLELGDEYQKALDELLREVAPRTQVQVSLLMEKPAQEARSASAPLRILEK